MVSTARPTDERFFEGGIMKTRTAYLAALLALGCGSTAPDATSPDLRPSPTGGRSLVGTAWILTEIRGEPPLGNEEITLVVDESTAGGNSGCNYYGGTPRITVGTFRLDDLVGTVRACEDARLMDQESDYLGILAQTSAWEIEGDELTLRTEAGEALVFRENG
jgi:heat shock protein HslJ